MNLVLHRLIRSDVDEIMVYYDESDKPELADDFYRELRRQFVLVVRNPFRNHFFKHDLRRANLKRFPFHFLYKVPSDSVRILVVRHHRRDPAYGLERDFL
jgi:plasmid stabilization system protein ParE